MAIIAQKASNKSRRISTRLFLTTTLIFIFAGIIAIILVNYTMRKQALREAKTKVQIIIDHNLAIHTYFTHKLKPKLFELTDPIKPNSYFEPVWMSSTYAVREIDKYFKSLFGADYYYKECAIGARSPENEADAYEKSFLEELNENPELMIRSDTRVLGDKIYFVVLQRGEVMKETCLRCHSTPNKAPEDLVRYYGPERSFHRKVGDVVSALSIRVPLSAAYAAAWHFSLQLSIALFIVFIVLFVLQYFINRHMLIKPLSVIQEKATLISTNKEHLGEEIPLPSGREMKELTVAFNVMSKKVQYYIEHLEDLVKERTAKLEEKSARLMTTIKDRDQVGRALQKSESKFRLLYENAPLGYQSLDETGCLIEVNQAWSELLGYTKDEVLGRSFGDFLSADSADDFKTNFSRFKAVGEISSVEFEMVKKDKSAILVSIDGRISYDKGGKLKKIHCILHNITERRRLEEQLRQVQKMESIGSLAGGIAHEFNNILGTIIGNTELAINDVPESNPARECLEEIQTASVRAKGVVRQLLGFARKSVFQLVPVQISPIVSETLNLIRASIPTTIEIRQNLFCKSDMVMADSTQISQVLINLCTNAKNAMQEEGGVLEVNLENTTLDENSTTRYEDLGPGNYLKLTVKDSGHGIDPENINRIFEPYFTTTNFAEGTGMGLAVVYGIVKNHNGVITVASEPGKGTVFEILFPLIEAEAEQEAGEPEAMPASNEKILFVDDEPSLVKMAKRMLEMQGYQVETKSNPVEALELIRSDPGRFDLIITDMTMPKMTGDRLAKEVLSIRPDMPIILCSGFSEKIDAEKARALGIRKYIEKPLDMSDFVVSIRKVLDAGRSKS